MRITDEMVGHACNAYYAHTSLGLGGFRESMRRAIEAALNSPPVVCKHCGKGEREHVLLRARNGLGSKDSFGCPDYVFEAAP